MFWDGRKGLPVREPRNSTTTFVFRFSPNWDCGNPHQEAISPGIQAPNCPQANIWIEGENNPAHGANGSQTAIEPSKDDAATNR
jgi:hypothetical protein